MFEIIENNNDSSSRDFLYQSWVSRMTAYFMSHGYNGDSNTFLGRGRGWGAWNVHIKQAV